MPCRWYNFHECVNISTARVGRQHDAELGHGQGRRRETPGRLQMISAKAQPGNGAPEAHVPGQPKAGQLGQTGMLQRPTAGRVCLGMGRDAVRSAHAPDVNLRCARRATRHAALIKHGEVALSGAAIRGRRARGGEAGFRGASHGPVAVAILRGRVFPRLLAFDVQVALGGVGSCGHICPW